MSQEITLVKDSGEDKNDGREGPYILTVVDVCRDMRGESPSKLDFRIFKWSNNLDDLIDILEGGGISLTEYQKECLYQDGELSVRQNCMVATIVGQARHTGEKVRGGDV